MIYNPSKPLTVLRDLIRCASVTPNAGEALDVVETQLTEIGFSCTRLTFEKPGTEPVDNLFARIGRGLPHLCFAGHVDVVPTGDEDKWSSPPFAAEVRDGMIVGRGAEDMKGAIASAICAARQIVEQDKLSNGSLSFLITGDEEGPSVNGTEPVLCWMAEHGHIPDVCIVGEPTCEKMIGDAIKIGRRGSLTGTLSVIGRQGHSAYPKKAANPIPTLINLLGAINHQLDHGSAHFPESHMEITTIDVGNPAHNIIPGQSLAQFNIRFNDQWTAISLEDHLRAQLEAVEIGQNISWHLDISSNAEAFLTEPGSFVQLLTDVISSELGCDAKLTTSGGTSDARFVVQYCPVVEFGLVGRSMHQSDEYIFIEELESLVRIYRSVMERYF